MYQYAAQNRNRGGYISVRNRVMLIVMAVLLVLVIFLGIRSITLSSFRSRAEDSFYHSMSSNVASAISVANRLDSTTSSTTSYTLGLVRQYIYSLDQTNKKSTVETREMLLTHLAPVQGYVNGDLAS